MKEIKNIKYFLKPEFIGIYSALLGEPAIIADKVLKNKVSWKEAVAIYCSLYSLSVFIYKLILKKHSAGSLVVLDFAIFQAIYIFIATAIIRTAWAIVGGNASYVSTFKFSLYTFGVLYVINSLLFPFELYLNSGGNRLIVFIAAFVGIYWITKKAWHAYGVLNGCDLFWKKLLSFLIASILVLVSIFALPVISRYFVTII